MITAKIQCSDEERIYHIGCPRSTGQVIHRKFCQDHLVKVRLFGELATVARRDVFELAVTSVREAINALHHLTKQRTTKLFAKLHDRVRWRVVVNGNLVDGKDPSILDELSLERDLETIEIYPVVQGSGFNWFEAIIGALLVIVGIVLAFVPGAQFLGGLSVTIGLDLALAGVALLLGGLLQLLNKPPAKPKPTQNNPSYLFGGVVNVVDQGGPVPVAYGQLICGSQLIAATINSSSVLYVGAYGSSTQIVGAGAGTAQPVNPTTAAPAPPVITPQMQTYMELTGMTEWPAEPEVATPQTGFLLGGPQFAIKHYDGSIGLIYGQDPIEDPEENRAFPQMINESIIVTANPIADILSYVNPNASIQTAA